MSKATYAAKREVTRNFWGVWFRDARGNELGPLFGGWHNAMHFPRYEGEPSRGVFFRTRRQAREWCRAERAKYADRADELTKWRFTPVRVTETAVCR